MANEVYSKIDSIPKGKAKDGLVEGCLVLEGGAFRGLYTQGMLDGWMEQGLNFQTVIGVSAGALAGMNYLSKQIGRSARANLGYRHYSAYIGLSSVKKAHSVIRLDFLLKDYNAIERLDTRSFYNPERRFVAVATNCDTGETMYYDRDECVSIFDAIKASASMPFVTPMVNVDGTPCLDGGCSCKIPYQWAIDNGYDKIVVIKTRENGFRKEVSDKTPASKVYFRHQAFAKKQDNSPRDYNRQCDELDELSAEGRVFVIAPSQKVTVSRIEGDMEKLGELYWLGYNDGLQIIPALKEYLAR